VNLKMVTFILIVGGVPGIQTVSMNTVKRIFITAFLKELGKAH
jgi:hypothetical protein